MANSNNYNNTQTNCSAPSLLCIIRNVFSKIPDHRTGTTKFTLADALMSGLAVFGLKYASLLNFDEDQDDPIIRHNLKTLYGVDLAPCDSQLREICDPVNPIAINPAFNRLHQSIRDQGLLKRYEYLDGFVLVSLDGTGQFSSNKLGCPQCCEKHHRNGTTEYYHQLLGAVVIHPDLPQVLPFMPEAILKGDGDSKNDCESNASKRLLPRLKKDHPDMLVNMVEYWEAKGGKVQNFSWITDIEITTGNVDKIVRGGRARWKIENETFNTLKNQGYHLEHNYGHGAENLATVFGALTFLAFLVDQIQALGCPLFKEAQNPRRTKISFWGCIRGLVTTNSIASWEALWNRIINAKKVIIDTG